MNIQGHGSSNPSILFVGDSPIGDDLNTKYALSGFMGNQIKTACAQNNINFNETFRTLLIKEDFSINKHIKQKKILWESVDKIAIPYLKQLKYEIETLNPFLIVPLGELGLHYLTGNNSIRKFRGSILLTDPVLEIIPQVKVLPILGPQLILKDYKMGMITKSIDYAKIPKYLNNNPPPENLIRPWVATSASEFRNFVDRCYYSSEFFTFDWETYCGIPVCIAFCFDGIEACCAPFMDKSIDQDNRMLMLDITAKLLSSPKNKGNQNIKYDWKIAERWGFRVTNVVDDSMLAASTLYCEYPKNLGFLTSIYTDIPYFKDEGKTPGFSKDIKKSKFYLYCAKDTIAAYQIRTDQITEVKHFGTEYVYRKLVQLTPVYMKMENRGIRIDEQQRQKLIDKYEVLFHLEVVRTRSLARSPQLNPLSSSQCDLLIFDHLGFTKVRGVKGTDEESLLLLLAHANEAKHDPATGKDIIRHILNCRKIHKVLEILQLAQYPDSRFRCEFNLAGTGTGRTSAGETTDELLVFGEVAKRTGLRKIEKKSLGHSLQTIGKHGFFIGDVQYGKDIRSMFVPSPGYIFVEIDLSQAEARVDAVLANNFKILEVFDGPIGVHRLTGSWVFGCDPLEIKKGTEQYHMAKTVRHAGERNMMADRMMAMTQKPIKECARILKVFHEFQPEIRNVFHRDITACISANDHTLVAPNGRRYTTFDRIDHKAVNKGISFLPQAIVSDQTKFHGIFETSEVIDWAFLLTEQHDGVLYEVPIGREEEFAVTYKKNIEKPIDFRSCSLRRDFELTIPCEIEIGETWLDLKKVDY